MLKKMLLSFAICLAFTGCGTKEEDKKTSTETNYSFSTDIAPIIVKSCAGSPNCHGAGETGGDLGKIYQANKDAFVADAAKVKELIQLPQTDSSSMPKPGYGIALASADKQKILDYLNQTSKN